MNALKIPVAHASLAVTLATSAALVTVSSIPGCSIVGIVGVSIAIHTLTFRVRGALRGLAGSGSGRWCFDAVRVRRSRARHRCVTGRPFGRLFDQDTVSTFIGPDEGYDTNVFVGTTRAFGARRKVPFNTRTVDSGNLGDV